MAVATSSLLAERVTLAYGRGEPVVKGVTFRPPDGLVTSIIGPNGCGKSTLLRALARLIAPTSGAVVLDGEAIHRQSTKEVAKRLGLLPQQQTAPESIVVEDLVSRGRYPHRSLFQPFGPDDQAAVERALELAGVSDLRDRPVDALSGGQRQRVWIAMALAQETPILLLDEPTTYLDLAHQREILQLIRRLNQEEGRTVVAVLHDINAAAWVSDYVGVMQAGELVAEGTPADVLRPELLGQVFGVHCDLIHPHGGSVPFCIVRGRTLWRAGAREGSFDSVAGAADRPVRTALKTEGLGAGYGRRRVVHDVSIAFPEGKVSVIVGPNACGKSTLLRSLARLLSPSEGAVWLHDRPVDGIGLRAFARQVGVLAQESMTPPGIIVEELVTAGRRPHQRWFRQWSAEDERVVERAMRATATWELRGRPVEALSGGQRQRVWLAMALAQETPILLLDEPTSFLDMAHQIELLDLVLELNRTEGKTVVMVLHDLCQACHYGDYVVAMKDGRIVSAGRPGDVVTEESVRRIFGMGCSVFPDPLTGTPLVWPYPASNQPKGEPM